MSNLRSRLSFANAMSVIAVFIALGGTGYAISTLPKNSVGSKQLKKSSVGTAKIKKEAVTAAKVKRGSLTGAQIDVSTLGVVPGAIRAGHADTAGRADIAGDAGTLQGNGPSAFVRGNGSTIVGRRDLDVDVGEPTLIELPGIGRVETECQAGPQSVFRTFNTSGETVDISELHKGVPSVFTIPNGGASANSALTGDVWQLQIATRGAAPTVATVEVTQGFAGPKACAIFAQATVVR